MLDDTQAATSELALVVHRLEKSYGQLKVLKSINWRVAKGDFVGLLGHNGAGKSTLIKTITGLASPDSGSIRVFDFDVVAAYRQTRRLVGIAAQEVNFDRFFPVLDILVYQAGYFGIPKKLARERAQYLLSKFGLWDKRNESITKLSGGMKRCLQVAKALIHDPQVIILDEPTAGVDIEVRRALWAFWRELNDGGKTIILTTHYLEEAIELCQTLAIIHQGNLVAEGKTQVLADAVEGDLSKYFATDFRMAS